jgi:prepilin-type N-terminal cleavage/methylation domain-containing protein
MKLKNRPEGLTLLEVMVTSALVAVIGLGVYALLNIGTVLGAKNAAVNVAHQQARTAMLQMLQDIHSSVSLPQLVDVNGAPITLPTPSPTPGAGQPTPSPSPLPKAEGIAFQLYASGPHRVVSDESVGNTIITVNFRAGQMKPVVGQRLIIGSHRIEETITAVSGGILTTPLGSNTDVNLTIANPLTVRIDGTNTNKIACFIADRCSYIVVNQELRWTGPTARTTFAVLGNNITNPKPFSTPLSPAGSPFYRFVAAIDLSTSDQHYNNRGFKSANILLNGQVPMRSRLITTQ